MNLQSRTHNSVKNIFTGFVAQLLQMVLSFVSRTIFIRYLAVEYLGVNSLFSNILTMLSLAELGVGSAFIYSLYKPLAERDEVSISTILQFYKKVYWIIGCVIFFSGLALMPFLDNIVSEKPENISESLYLLYFIFLFNTASTYFFSYKTSLLNADQKNSVATMNQMIFSIIQNVFQILVLILTQNFIAYLVVQTVVTLLSNFYISNTVDRRYSFLKKYKTGRIDKNLKENIISNTKSTFLIKIGGVLVNGTDNLFINYFVGLAVLGKFSNYLMLVSLATNFTAIIFSNLSSSIAHLIVTENLDKQKRIFNSLNFLNFWIFGFCSLMIVFLTNDFIKLWIGESFLLSRDISIMMAVNFFMVGMQSGFWTFKSAYGFFKQGRYVVLLTALFNLIFSFVLGYYFGIFGILMGTALARLITNFWYDPYIVLTLGLKVKPIQYFFKFLGYLILLLVSGIIVFFSTEYFSFKGWWFFLLKILAVVAISNLLITIVFYKTPEFRDSMDKIKSTVLLLKGKIDYFLKLYGR